MTQAGLGERVGVTGRTIQRAETEAGCRLGASTIRRLAAVLSVSEHELLRVSSDELCRRLRRLGLAAPAPPEPWVERPAELDWIRERLGGRTPRMCCIAGPSGIGKSALARRVAQEMSMRFPHGVIWVDASREGQPADALALQLRIAGALVWRLPPPDVVPADIFAEAFVAALWEQPRLLVLNDVVDINLLHSFGADKPGSIILATTHLLHVAEHFSEDVLVPSSIGVADTRRILVQHLGEDRVRADQDGVRRLHDALGGIPRNIHIAGQILLRERLVGLGEYARRILRDPAAGQYPEALCGPATSLMASFARIQAYMSTRAWELLGVLSVFGEEPFSLERAAAAAGISTDALRVHLSELIDTYLVVEESARGTRAAASAGGGQWFRLDSHVALFARGVLLAARAANGSEAPVQMLPIWL